MSVDYVRRLLLGWGTLLLLYCGWWLTLFQTPLEVAKMVGPPLPAHTKFIMGQLLPLQVEDFLLGILCIALSLWSRNKLQLAMYISAAVLMVPVGLVVFWASQGIFAPVILPPPDMVPPNPGTFFAYQQLDQFKSLLSSLNDIIRPAQLNFNIVPIVSGVVALVCSISVNPKQGMTPLGSADGDGR